MTTTTLLVVLAACSLISLVHTQRLWQKGIPSSKEPLGRISFDEHLGQLSLTTTPGSREVIADLSNNGLNQEYSDVCTANGAEICRQWRSKKTQLTISPQKDGWRQVTWTTKLNSNINKQHTNCFPLGIYHWFGGPEQITQKWPVDLSNYSDYSYISKEKDNQAVADPFWFNSNGLAIIVEKGVPLFIDQNSNRPNHLCLVAKIDAPYRSRTHLVLSYKIGYHGNAKEAFLRSVNDVLGKPSGIPDTRMVRYPIWSTWALYKAKINETVVRSFANDILKWNFTNSQLEIDDNWETCYGSGEFNKEDFPDIGRLVADLHRDGFRVTLWSHPFVNTDCQNWNQLLQIGYFASNSSTAESRWWNGKASVIDFTNVEAAKYWEEKHKHILKTTGIDSFKFDAGETSWMPRYAQLSVPASPLEDYPSEHTNQYLRTCAKFGSMAEYRSAHRTQDLPIFLRMIDKDTKWGYDNGLKTLVTTLLQLNMVGYPFVLPDMIGGNVYEGATLTKELFIRWLQANTFMPVLQYSRVPWEFDDTTIEISRKYTELHSQYADLIIELMQNSTIYGTPVNPPIWWNDPTDEIALKIDSEYMLGENILVAPILDEGATRRNIYLPEGLWIDRGSSNGTFYKGKTWLTNYYAPIDVLPYFERL